MDTAAYHPLPDIFLSNYQSFSGGEYSHILLSRIVSVNPHIRASKNIQSLTQSKLARLSLRGSSQAALYCARRTSTFLSCAFREQEDDQAAHPILLGRALREHRRTTGHPPALCSASKRAPDRSPSSFKIASSLETSHHHGGLPCPLATM